MRATDIIRQVLNMIDAIDTNAAQGAMHAQPAEISIELDAGEPDELARMKQIAGLVGNDETQYSNQPQERIAGIESVTTDAGGGVNGPKNPADMRSNSISMYPNHQHNPGV
jgi:hypothetical protein